MNVNTIRYTHVTEIVTHRYTSVSVSVVESVFGRGMGNLL